jgi:hypothetical protein
MTFNLTDSVQQIVVNALEKFNNMVDSNLDTFMSLNKITVEDFQKNGLVKNHFASYFGDKTYKQICYHGKEIFKVTAIIDGKNIKIETTWAK